jgi:Ca-activated chloride channel family protein
MVAARLGGAMKPWRIIQSPVALLAVTVLCSLAYCLLSGPCSLLSADRQAHRAFSHGDYALAARRFVDPQWRATALYRDGEFAQAAGIWSGWDTATGAFNHGNALLLQGLYEQAAQRYTRSLELQPDWPAAQENRAIALSRAKALEKEGDERTGGMLGADEFVFSPASANNPPGDNDTEQVEAGTSDAAMREIWLRQVQTRPADFLRSKFAYQHATRSTAETD